MSSLIFLMSDISSPIRPRVSTPISRQSARVQPSCQMVPMGLALFCPAGRSVCGTQGVVRVTAHNTVLDSPGHSLLRISGDGRNIAVTTPLTILTMDVTDICERSFVMMTQIVNSNIAVMHANVIHWNRFRFTFSGCSMCR